MPPEHDPESTFAEWWGKQIAAGCVREEERERLRPVFLAGYEVGHQDGLEYGVYEGKQGDFL